MCPNYGTNHFNFIYRLGSNFSCLYVVEIYLKKTLTPAKQSVADSESYDAKPGAPNLKI